ncbi:MAG TPA: retroviral-like aspartic protease family protein [Allosphingosinicella sp.]|nr:retroviral-like aspartic protease family protein [Allosphingosinicella sp.]
MADPRLSLLAICAALCFAAPGATQPETQAPVTETHGWDLNGSDRMTVPISIGGRGPYRFIVDTGSERTVLSRELAQRLGLAAGIPVVVHSMTEVRRTSTAVVPSLRLGRRRVDNIHAPLLSQHTLGADGLLGVDSLVSQRVELDFTTNEMSVTPSRRRTPAWDGAGAIVVRARSRFGRLILVDAAFNGERVWVIVDTGAEISIANEALRRRLQRRGRLGPTVPLEVVSVTGGTRIVDYGVAERVRIGTTEIANLPVGFADVEPFRQLGLIDRPAILLGMDALQLFDRVSLDFANREVRLQSPASAPPRRPASP